MRSSSLKKSIAANLRQAFGESELLQRGYQKVRVYIDTPILLVPIEEFHEDAAYCETAPGIHPVRIADNSY